MSGSFPSVQRNACVRRLDLGLHSHPKEFWGMESVPCKLQGQNPLWRLRGGSNLWRCIRQDSQPNTLPPELFQPSDKVSECPTHYHLSCSSPLTKCLNAKHTTTWAVPALWQSVWMPNTLPPELFQPSEKVSECPTHLSCSSPLKKCLNAQHTWAVPALWKSVWMPNTPELFQPSDKVSECPTHLSCSSPLTKCLNAQHTWAVQPSGKVSECPKHYHLSCSSPLTKCLNAQNTTTWAIPALWQSVWMPNTLPPELFQPSDKVSECPKHYHLSYSSPLTKCLNAQDCPKSAHWTSLEFWHAADVWRPCNCAYMYAL